MSFFTQGSKNLGKIKGTIKVPISKVYLNSATSSSKAGIDLSIISNFTQ